MKTKFVYRKKNYYIESDECNFIVCEGYKRTKENPKKPEHVTIRPILASYHANLEQSCNELLTRAIKGSLAKDCKELIQDIKEIKKAIQTALNIKII